jgi:hypothetical protein
MKLRHVDVKATPKYAHVGHARVSFAHAVRVTVWPLDRVTVRHVSFVARNLASVRDMGMRTTMEMRKARMREMRRRRRMRALRTWRC